MISPNEQKTASLTSASGSKITPKELWTACLLKWKWILASLIICLGMSALYLAWKPETFTRTAQVEIKDDEEAGSSALSMFSDMGLIQANSNLYNEMAFFESPDLMEGVVDRLGLQTSYNTKAGLRTVPLYGSSEPVKVSFETLPSSKGGSFKMKIEENGDIYLHKFVIKKKTIKFDQKKPIRFGQLVETPLGKIKIEPTPFFQQDTTYKINVGRMSVKGATDYWLSKLTVSEYKKEASIVNLTVSDMSPARATDVLNALIQIYNEDWIKNKNEIALASSDFINERLDAIAKELSDVDTDISGYKSANQVPDVVTSATLYMAEDQQTRQAILDLNNQLQMARFLKDFIEKDQSPDRVLPVNTGIINTSLDAQIGSYNNMVLSRNNIVANSSAANPIAQDYEQQISAARKVIVASVDNQIKQLSTDITNLTKSKKNAESHISSNPEQARVLLSVERQQKVKESLYMYLLQKREENQLNQAFTAYNTRIIARPNGDPEPTSPKPMVILALGFIIGLALPLGVIYVREISNTTVRDKTDLAMIHAPFLGEIPKVRGKKHEGDKDHKVVVSPGNRDVVNEAFRVVRTNLNFMLGDDAKCPVMMVTSFNPGSGKTFFTINLAISIAIRGKKVLVIDGDMRRNSTSDYIGNPHTGLAQYLSGKVKNIDEVIVKGTLQENLDILPGGATPPNPTELLENGKLHPMIEHLRSEYDIIFIDNAPIQMIADGRIFSTVCTGTIFVIRAGLFDRGLLPEVEALYQSKEYKNMSILLNDTDSAGGYGSYGAYGSKNYYAQK